MKVTTTFVICLLCLVSSFAIENCEINPLGTTPKAPLLIHAGTTSLIYPNPGENTIKLSADETIEFSCPPDRHIVASGFKLGTTEKATCQSGETFEIQGMFVEWRSVTCSKAILPTIKELTVSSFPDDDPIKSCSDVERQLSIGAVGFALDSYRFLSIINICFNTTSKLALYSSYSLTNSIADGAESATSAIKQDDIFYKMGKSVDEIYKNNQSTINALLGLPYSSDKYINQNTFISKGYLAAKEDFYYANLQVAVSRYINIAPQWSSFTEGNWKIVGKDIRSYVGRRNVNLQIWAGVYGTAVLNNEITSLSEDLYLYYPTFQVPGIFWKIIYNQTNQTGIILVGHNDPYQAIITEGQKICSDVSDKIVWLNWDKTSILKGYSYACDYNDPKFHSLVPFSPKLIVRDLLY